MFTTKNQRFEACPDRDSVLAVASYVAILAFLLFVVGIVIAPYLQDNGDQDSDEEQNGWSLVTSYAFIFGTPSPTNIMYVDIW